MSLNSLPSELLREIIEAAIPHSYHSATYKDRQQTLCNLCLVSRRFRQIAQPLLFEIVKIKSEQDFQQVLKSLSANDRSNANLKSLTSIFWDARQKWVNASAIGMLSVVCPALSALNIAVFCARHPSLDHLSPFPDLSDLQLYGLSFHPATPFLSLRSLTLSGFHAISTVFSTSESVVLPSLRYLALTRAEAVFRNYRLSNNSMLAQLLPQLEAWSIDLDGLEDAHTSGDYSTLHPFLSRALVDYRIWNKNLHPTRSNVTNDVRHLRLLHDFYDDELERLLSLCTSIVESRPHSKLPRAIYLGRPSPSYPLFHGPQARPFQDVEKVCKEKGIELVFDQQPCDIIIDPVVSHEFWRRMKTVRNKGNVSE